jgi:hypothetical protein
LTDCHTPNLNERAVSEFRDDSFTLIPVASVEAMDEDVGDKNVVNAWRRLFAKHLLQAIAESLSLIRGQNRRLPWLHGAETWASRSP